MTEQAPAGWYPDPDAEDTQRYWDGERWTDSRAPLTKSIPAELWFALASAVAVCIGSFGPWATAVLASKNGLDGDGVVTLVLGLIALAGAIAAIRGGVSRGTCLLFLICGVLAAAVAIYDIADIYATETTLFGRDVRVVSPGWGVWVAAAGGVAMAVSSFAIWTMKGRGNPPTASPAG